MSAGTAKPTPEPSPELVRICELIPSTRPPASSSGPPELPELIAASVWIAPDVRKPVSDWMSRSSAEITPTDSERSSPNGEPIAATGAPTTRSSTSASSSGLSSRPSVSTRSSATSEKGSRPTMRAGDLVAGFEVDEDLGRALERAALARGDDVGVRDDLAAVARRRSPIPGRRPNCRRRRSGPRRPPSRRRVRRAGRSRWDRRRWSRRPPRRGRSRCRCAPGGRGRRAGAGRARRRRRRRRRRAASDSVATAASAAARPLTPRSPG